MTYPDTPGDDEPILSGDEANDDGLGAMDDQVNWSEEEAGATGEFEKLPDGEYIVRVDDTKLDRTSKTKKPRFVWKLKVASGPHQKRVIWKENILAPDKAKWLKGDLKKAGLEIEKATDLRERRTELHGRLLRVKLDTVQDYQRVYVNGVVKPEDLQDAGPSVLDQGGTEDAVDVTSSDSVVTTEDDDDGVPF